MLLEKETIQKLINKDSALMNKLKNKVDYTSRNYLKNDIQGNIGRDFIDDIENVIKNELDYGLTEYEKPEVDILRPTTEDKTDIWLPNWL